MLLALLLPDPSDKHCPEAFKTKAKKLLPLVGCGKGETDEGLRNGVIKFIGDFANWGLSTNVTYGEVARGLVKAAHAEDTPLVVDPFAGGGSIPLEGLRLGCEAFASDLNPVACLIEKTKLIDVPRKGPGLANELLLAGKEIKKQAEKDLAEFYPSDPDGAQPIAYLWARTVHCEAPDCGAEIPLVRSFWLSKKPKRYRALKPQAVKPRGGTPRVEFEIFEPQSDDQVAKATVNRAKGTCVCCGRTLAPERVRAQLAAQRGGADAEFDAKGHRTGGARLLAVVILKAGTTGRQYRLPGERDYEAVWKAHKMLRTMVAKPSINGLSAVPDEPLPPIGTLGFRVQRYGMLKWGDLFSARQSLALATLAKLVSAVANESDREMLALSVSKLAERNNSICDWMVGVECPGHLYSQQIIPPAWDFAEATPLGESSGSFELTVESTAASASACWTGQSTPADIGQFDATELPLPDESVDIYFTDPPYYDAVPYSDLSDFFFVWLKRALPKHALLHDQFDPQNPLTPKQREVVQDETKSFENLPKDRDFFERRMSLGRVN